MLLAGAAFVKKKFSDSPALVAPSTVQADPQAWQRMADLNKAERAVRDLLKVVQADHAVVVAAQRARQQSEQGNAAVKKSFEEQAQLAQTTFSDARKRLDVALDKYQTLGGTVDYRSQVPNN